MSAIASKRSIGRKAAAPDRRLVEQASFHYVSSRLRHGAFGKDVNLQAESCEAVVRAGNSWARVGEAPLLAAAWNDEGPRRLLVDRCDGPQHDGAFSSRAVKRARVRR